MQLDGSVSFKYPADNLTYMLLDLGSPNRKTALQRVTVVGVVYSWKIYAVKISDSS